MTRRPNLARDAIEAVVNRALADGAEPIVEIPACVICGGAIAEGELAEMYRREDEAEEDGESGFVHAECGLAAGWEVS